VSGPGAATAELGIVGLHVTQWNRDPWTGGVYSTLAVGARPDDRRTLAEPVGGRLVLAGEHTSVPHPATMHGAYNSGLAAAGRLRRLQPGAREAIVVGAGLSGLAAARSLLRQGLRVTVLEATEHIGGRARTETLAGGIPFHPGAAWIHGIDGNPLVPLAERSGVAFRPWPAHVRHARVGFGPLGEEAVADLEGALRKVEDALAGASVAARSAGGPDVAMRGPLVAALATVADPQVRAAVATRLLLHFESLVAGIVDDLSFQHGDEPFAYPGGDAYVLSPLRPMVNALAEGIDIRRSTPVGRVELCGDRVRVHIDGGALAADVAVVTVPLGPLQSGSLRFEPELPARHQEALGRLRMGEKAKVFVRFERRWWGDAEELWLYPADADGSGDVDWALWVDATEPTGVPMLCGFLGGRPALRAQELGSTPEGRRLLAAEVSERLRWLR
jgi:monoamine oxidase